MMELNKYKNDYKIFCEKADNYLAEYSFKEAIKLYKKAITSIKLLVLSIKYNLNRAKLESNEDYIEDLILKKKLNDCLIINKPKVNFDNIVGLEKAKQILKEATIIPFQFPHLFAGKRQPTKSILLFGPPGNGKSYLVRALSSEANISFFSISPANIISKYKGETKNLVKNLFDLAREKKPSIIFFDQIDYILRESFNEETISLKNEFIRQMKEVNNYDKNILVLGETNIPWELNSFHLIYFRKKYI